ncbi:YD repeat-containing protein [Pontibacter mucosus]|uniref:YD repeat-containing protein n=1 Tax=Pontibacter mucosus TaxID=1649266 RepID=A0A2T5YD64_9BACT|nr:hypothetical protein [Pontibacter mucosus]PTX14462.1 YD repeat-containing protein [Pontibacter mucosus]
MKQSYLFAILLLLFASCEDAHVDELTPAQGTYLQNATAYYTAAGTGQSVLWEVTDYDTEGFAIASEKRTAPDAPLLLEVYRYDGEQVAEVDVYDAADNHLDTRRYVFTDGKPTSYTSAKGTYTLTYDSRGNVVEASNGAETRTWAYTYDNQDRVQTMEFTPEGSAARYRYEYSYRDRHRAPVGAVNAIRVHKQEASGFAYVGTVVYRYTIAPY